MSTITAPQVRTHKVRAGKDPLVMVTAYDAPSARMADEAGVDLILVGDSVAMVVLGYDDTLQVTVDDLAHHTAAVARAKPKPLVVADLPWLSYHVSVEDSVRNAATLIRAGAEAVKLEGGRKRLSMIEAIVDAEIPVMGHLGLTPQSIYKFGTYRVRAREEEEAEQLRADAKLLEEAGCFGIVIEKIPATLAAEVTASVSIPTIGIGAGPDCSGQVLVTHDLLGLTKDFRPRFVRRYAEIEDLMHAAVGAYIEDVRTGDFPAAAESY